MNELHITKPPSVHTNYQLVTYWYDTNALYMFVQTIFMVCSFIEDSLIYWPNKENSEGKWRYYCSSGHYTTYGSHR